MTRSATDRLKVNPPLGRMPTLQFVLPGELQVDDSYQRSVAGGDSQALIKRIAQHWNWDLCQPLVVSRRAGTTDLFVIDGQHRLAAAQLRSDIAQLPCVIVDYAGAADEAASFVHLNQQRRPLSRLEVFRAAVASGDSVALGIVDALVDAGLKLAKHSNCASWQPGEVGIVGGLEVTWKSMGPNVTRWALKVLAAAFDGQVLRYAGTIWPGIAAACEALISDGAQGEANFAKLVQLLRGHSQIKWRSIVLQERAEDPALGMRRAAVLVVFREWSHGTGKTMPKPAAEVPPPAPVRGKAGWCDQCDARVTAAEAGACNSRFCKMKAVAA